MATDDDRWSWGSYSGAYPEAEPIPPPPEADPKPPPKKTRPPVTRDLEFLVPPFRQRVELLVSRLKDNGYQPMVWETIRTLERGRWLEKKGRSKNGARSMHIYGVAVDIICADHRWNCGKKDCPFFYELGSVAKELGLYWGGDWKSFKDLPHVQAVHVREQRFVRQSEDVEATIRKLMRVVGDA